MSQDYRRYLPAWVPWCALLFTVPAWLLITHSVFYTEGGRSAFGVGDWVLSSLILVFATVVLFLMGYGKLPFHFSR